MYRGRDAKKKKLRTDSQLVVSQFRGDYEAREPAMQKYLKMLRDLAAQLQSFEIELVPRAENSQADALSKLASSTLQDLNRTVVVEVMERKSIEEPEQVNCVARQKAWYNDMLKYKLSGDLPEDPNEAKRMKKDGHWYTIFKGELYRKAFSKPLMRCIPE